MRNDNQSTSFFTENIFINKIIAFEKSQESKENLVICMKFLPCYNTSDNKGVMKFEKGVFKIISEFSYLRLKFIPEFVMLIYIKYVISENNI
jgi:hypothetical protein